jgi:hypothetical protein
LVRKLFFQTNAGPPNILKKMLGGPPFFIRKWWSDLFLFFIYEPHSLLLFLEKKKKLTLPSPQTFAGDIFSLNTNISSSIRLLASYLLLFSSKTAAPSAPFNFVARCSFKITQANLVFIYVPELSHPADRHSDYDSNCMIHDSITKHMIGVKRLWNSFHFSFPFFEI